MDEILIEAINDSKKFVEILRICEENMIIYKNILQLFI